MSERNMSEGTLVAQGARRLAVSVGARAIADDPSLDIIEVAGDGSCTVDGAMPINMATASDISFCSRTGAAGAALIDASNAGIIVCTAEAAALVVQSTAALLITPTPRLTFARIVTNLFAPAPPRGRHPTAWVHPKASVADDVYLGPYVVIEDACEVGAGCVLHAHVCLYPGTRLGERVTLHAGVIIGADGFGHERNASGALEKFPQIGGVQIGNDVEIGANSCVSRGTLTDTIVESGVRMDNLVHIAHNVVVGVDAVLTANAMIAGSARIGARAWIAPSVSIMDGGVTIGEDAIVGMGAVVIKSVADNAIVVGNPARALERRTPLRGAA